jgi:excisionase family DNA binding protein
MTNEISSKLKASPHSATPLMAPPSAQLHKLLYDYDEAAWSLGMSKRKLYRLVSEGRVPVVKVDGSTLFKLEDLQAFADQPSVRRNEYNEL